MISKKRNHILTHNSNGFLNQVHLHSHFNIWHRRVKRWGAVVVQWLAKTFSRMWWSKLRNKYSFWTSLTTRTVARLKKIKHFVGNWKNIFFLVSFFFSFCPGKMNSFKWINFRTYVLLPTSNPFEGKEDV